VEYFQDQALILLTLQDTILTVNRAAAELLELLQVTFEERYFSAEDLSALLTQHYDINRAAALIESREVLSSWLQNGVLVSINSGTVEALNE